MMLSEMIVVGTINVAAIATVFVCVIPMSSSRMNFASGVQTRVGRRSLALRA